LQKIVQKLDDIRVYVTISCGIISFITTSLAIDYLAIFGVLTLGILHGANDLSLLQSIRFMRTKSQCFLVYIATVLLFSAPSKPGTFPQVIPAVRPHFAF
jgi:hypothetical protein